MCIYTCVGHEPVFHLCKISYIVLNTSYIIFVYFRNVDVGKNDKFDVTTYNNCSQMWFMIADNMNNSCFNIPNSNLLQPFFVYSTKGTHANSPGGIFFNYNHKTTIITSNT